MLFSVPCCEVHQIFFFWLSIVMRSAITTFKLKEVSTVNGMFPELQTALSIFQKQVAIAGNGFPLYTFSKIYFQPSSPSLFCHLTPNSCTFEVPIWVRHTNPVQALNVARLHLAVLGGRVFCVNNCCCVYGLLGGLNEGQHRPKAGKKKKTREAGLFFLVPASY